MARCELTVDELVRRSENVVHGVPFKVRAAVQVTPQAAADEIVE